MTAFVRVATFSTAVVVSVMSALGWTRSVFAALSSVGFFAPDSEPFAIVLRSASATVSFPLPSESAADADDPSELTVLAWALHCLGSSSTKGPRPSCRRTQWPPTGSLGPSMNAQHKLTSAGQACDFPGRRRSHSQLRSPSSACTNQGHAAAVL